MGNVQISGAYKISETSVIETDLGVMHTNASGASVFVIPDQDNKRVFVGIVEW